MKGGGMVKWKPKRPLALGVHLRTVAHWNRLGAP